MKIETDYDEKDFEELIDCNDDYFNFQSDEKGLDQFSI